MFFWDTVYMTRDYLLHADGHVNGARTSRE